MSAGISSSTPRDPVWGLSDRRWMNERWMSIIRSFECIIHFQEACINSITDYSTRIYWAYKEVDLHGFISYLALSTRDLTWADDPLQKNTGYEWEEEFWFTCHQERIFFQCRTSTSARILKVCGRQTHDCIRVIQCLQNGIMFLTRIIFHASYSLFVYWTALLLQVKSV